MRIFSCVSYVTETKYIEGINWLCPGVVDFSNQTICSEWTGINFANRSPRLRAVASCAAYLSSSEVGLFMTNRKLLTPTRNEGSLYLSMMCVNITSFNTSDYIQLIMHNCKIFIWLLSSRVVSQDWNTVIQYPGTQRFVCIELLIGSKEEYKFASPEAIHTATRFTTGICTVQSSPQFLCFWSKLQQCMWDSLTVMIPICFEKKKVLPLFHQGRTQAMEQGNNFNFLRFSFFF